MNECLEMIGSSRGGARRYDDNEDDYQPRKNLLMSYLTPSKEINQKDFSFTQVYFQQAKSASKGGRKIEMMKGYFVSRPSAKNGAGRVVFISHDNENTFGEKFYFALPQQSEKMCGYLRALLDEVLPLTTYETNGYERYKIDKANMPQNKIVYLFNVYVSEDEELKNQEERRHLRRYGCETITEIEEDFNGVQGCEYGFEDDKPIYWKSFGGTILAYENSSKILTVKDIKTLVENVCKDMDTMDIKVFVSKYISFASVLFATKQLVYSDVSPFYTRVYEKVQVNLTLLKELVAHYIFGVRDKNEEAMFDETYMKKDFEKFFYVFVPQCRQRVDEDWRQAEFNGMEPEFIDSEENGILAD